MPAPAQPPQEGTRRLAYAAPCLAFGRRRQGCLDACLAGLSLKAWPASAATSCASEAAPRAENRDCCPTIATQNVSYGNSSRIQACTRLFASEPSRATLSPWPHRPGGAQQPDCDVPLSL